MGAITDWAVQNGVTWENAVKFGGGLVLFLILCAICGVVIYFVAIRKKYNITIKLIEKVHGLPKFTSTDVAAETIIPGRGIKLLVLKKLRTNFGKFLPMPHIESGYKEYWYIKGKDGEWINVGMEDFDAKREQMGLKLDPTDIRNQRAALQKLLRDNYKKEKWWQTYAPYIALTVLILMLGISSWLVADKNIDAINVGKEVAKIHVESLQMQKEVLAAMDNVCSGSGLRIGD